MGEEVGHIRSMGRISGGSFLDVPTLFGWLLVPRPAPACWPASVYRRAV